MKVLESDIVRWLLRTSVVLATFWFGPQLTFALLAFILGSFGFFAFALISTTMSYFLFWFAFFGLPWLIARNDKTQTSTFISHTGVVMVFFAFTAAITASGSSAIYLIRTVEQAYPERPILLWLIAIPLFGFILFIALKVDKADRRESGGNPDQ